jgi:hypothetical protein
MMAMTKGLLVILTTLGLASCKGSSEVKTAARDNGTERKKLACADVHVDMNTAHIDWYEENKSVLNTSGEILVLPKNYKIYGVDTSQLRSFFNAVQAGNTVITVLPLPSPADCQLFTVNNNLKEGAKVPQGMIMAAGESNGQKAALNYYRENLTAHINWFDIQYEMMTVKANGLPYIVVYEKTPPPPDPNKNRKEEKPELIELRYNK